MHLSVDFSAYLCKQVPFFSLYQFFHTLLFSAVFGYFTTNSELFSAKIFQYLVFTLHFHRKFKFSIHHLHHCILKSNTNLYFCGLLIQHHKLTSCLILNEQMDWSRGLHFEPLKDDSK